MNSCVFFRSAGTCVTMLFNDPTKNVDSGVAGVSFSSPFLCTLGKQYTEHGSGSQQMLSLSALDSSGCFLLYLFAILLS